MFPYPSRVRRVRLWRAKRARYTVFTPQAVYYLTRTAAADFVVRAYVTREKTVRFSLAALGKTDTELYLAGYFNCFLMHAAAECCETPWFRQCRAIPSGFEFYSVEDLDRSTPPRQLRRAHPHG